MQIRKRLAVFGIYVLVLGIFVTVSIGGSRAVTAWNAQSELLGRKVIVIDPGHGGVDGGATGVTGASESQINLEISLRLNDLMHLMGVRTLMIRQDDRSVYTQGQTIAAKKMSDLKERVRMCRESGAVLFISIHQNYFTDGRYKGPQVFYNASEQGRGLAGILQKSLNESLMPESNRKIKKAQGVYLMEHISCPGILVECGFLSNFQEEQMLKDTSYQKKLCCVIAIICADYLKTAPDTGA